MQRMPMVCMKSAEDKDDLAVATALSSPTDKPGLDRVEAIASIERIGELIARLA